MKIKILLALSALMLTGSAWADSIIFVPRGTTLTTRQFRGQVMFSGSGDEGNFFAFSLGLKQLEMGYTHAEYPDNRTEELLNAQWNVLPETFITPAIGVGVRDITSASKEGIGFYGSLTKHIPVSGLSNYIQDFAVTVGTGNKSMNGFFCGAEASFPMYLVGQIEYDGDNCNTAICWQPADTFRLKYYTIDSNAYFGFEFTPLEF